MLFPSRQSCGAALAGVLVALAAAPVTAQEELRDDRVVEEREQKPVMMGERTYRRLAQIHELMGNAKYDEALQKARVLEKGQLSDYERALILQTIGFVYSQEGKYSEAIPLFEQVLALDALPTPAHQGMLYSLAGLYASQGQYRESIDTLRRWFKYEADPQAGSFIMMASNFAELAQEATEKGQQSAAVARYNEALPYVRKAIQKSDDPKESWYQLELAIHYETKDFDGAVGVLQTMVSRWPDKVKYWDLLSGAYQEKGEDKNALAAMMLAYQKGLVTEEKKLLNLVRFNLFLDIPYDGGKLLEKELAAGRVEPTQKNLEVLLQAWTTAKEFDRAIAVIDRIAPMTDSGDYYIQKAQLYNEKAEWDGVVAASAQAIDKGSLKKPGEAYLLRGLALAELGRYDDAIDVLKEAKNVSRRLPKQRDRDRIRKQAEAWIEYVRDRKRVRG